MPYIVKKKIKFGKTKFRDVSVWRNKSQARDSLPLHFKLGEYKIVKVKIYPDWYWGKGVMQYKDI